mmetsp:Transcript_41798/g.133361  ORF Transcript_41798/g.133361 Transcript_41798/m.133361 type:complete len:222 (-) Transcript_41798:172-837(-)
MPYPHALLPTHPGLVGTHDYVAAPQCQASERSRLAALAMASNVPLAAPAGPSHPTQSNHRVEPMRVVWVTERPRLGYVRHVRVLVEAVPEIREAVCEGVVVEEPPPLLGESDRDPPPVQRLELDLCPARHVLDRVAVVWGGDNHVCLPHCVRELRLLVALDEVETVVELLIGLYLEHSEFNPLSLSRMCEHRHSPPRRTDLHRVVAWAKLVDVDVHRVMWG